MARTTAFVWYGPSGEIVATGRPFGKAKVIPLTGEDQSVLETEVEEEELAELHLTHRVDPGQKAMVRRQLEGPSAE